jgi:hypothetical protein
MKSAGMSWTGKTGPKGDPAMPRFFVQYLAAFAALASLAACAPVGTGELERLYNRENNDRLTQIAGRQDFRTFRQKTPSFLLP